VREAERNPEELVEDVLWSEELEEL